jgi:hypothetical protein
MKLVFSETVKMPENTLCRIQKITIYLTTQVCTILHESDPQTLHILTLVMKWIWQEFKLEAFGIEN